MSKQKYLIDTDWVIHYLNGNKKIIDKVLSLSQDGIAISVISLGELYEGVYYSSNPAHDEQVLSEFLSSVPVLEIDGEICKIFGKERGRLRRIGKVGIDFDLLIAATCLRWDMTLLTNNLKHYGLVNDLKIISSSY